MEIPILVRECLEQFRMLLDDSQDDNLDEEYGRFKIWTGNLAAHREGGSRSLEHRLRDSENLRTRVLSLLQDLLTELKDYSDVRLHDHEERAPLEAAELPFVDDDLGTDDSVQEIHELVNLLYRFSMTLKNPAGDNRVRRACVSRSAVFDPFFLPHVQTKYPLAQAWLAQRLGRAISSNHQYCLYREEHGKKKYQGLDDDGPDEQATTTATSVPGIEPPTLDVADLNRDVGETQSIYSMTSFAPTESDASILQPPRLPEEAADGDPFNCPICHSIVQFTSEERWRQHVYEDVPPYVCTHEFCSIANMQYTRRRNWQRHMSRNHFRVWKCSMGCSAKFETAADLMAHLVDDHKQQDDLYDLQILAETSAEPMPFCAALACPLCQKPELTLSSWFKHVGRHMEQLALFALPSHLLEDEQEGQDEDQVSGGVAIETSNDSRSISDISSEGTRRDGNDLNEVAEAMTEDHSRVGIAQDSEVPPDVTTTVRPRGSSQKAEIRWSGVPLTSAPPDGSPEEVETLLPSRRAKPLYRLPTPSTAESSNSSQGTHGGGEKSASLGRRLSRTYQERVKGFRESMQKYALPGGSSRRVEPNRVEVTDEASTCIDPALLSLKPPTSPSERTTFKGDEPRKARRFLPLGNRKDTPAPTTYGLPVRRKSSPVRGGSPSDEHIINARDSESGKRAA